MFLRASIILLIDASICLSVRVFSLSCSFIDTAYDFLPAGRFLPSYTSKRRTSRRSLRSALRMTASISANLTLLSTSSARSRSTGWVFGSSAYVTRFLAVSLKRLSQSMAAYVTLCSISNFLSIEERMIPTSAICLPERLAISSFAEKISSELWVVVTAAG